MSKLNVIFGHFIFIMGVANCEEGHEEFLTLPKWDWGTHKTFGRDIMKGEETGERVKLQFQLSLGDFQQQKESRWKYFEIA